MDACPVKFHQRPKGFYSVETPESPGLSPVSLKRPENPTSRESRRCGQCNAKNWLLGDANEAICTECGAVVSR